VKSDAATDANSSRHVPAGAAKPAPKCLSFLQASEKANEQWQLEHRLDLFESSLP
jgi:adenosine deaminase